MAYASRTLMDAEKQYSQLDKEALAIVFGVKKIHHYLHGRKFSIASDHKPLQYLLNEPRAVATCYGIGKAATLGTAPRCISVHYLLLTRRETFQCRWS